MNATTSPAPAPARVLQAHGATDEERILWAAAFAPGPNGRRGLPLVLVGEPGTVKTASFAELAAQTAMHFEAVVSSLRDPTDFLGMPTRTTIPLTSHNQHLSPDGDDHLDVTGYLPPGFAVRATMAQRAIMLLDEVNTCPPAVQAALLRVLFEGYAGDFKLGAGVRMFLAMNRREDSAGGWNVALPLANRVGWLDWKGRPLSSFFDYLMAGGGCAIDGRPRRQVTPRVDPREEERLVDQAWPAAWAHAIGIVQGFLSSHSDLSHRKPTAKERAAGIMAWPSYRTWDLAACALAASHAYSLPTTAEELFVAAYIGNSVLQELHEWRDKVDLPKAADVLDGRASFRHSPTRLDRTVAVIASCTALVVDKTCPGRKERADALWELHRTLPDDAVDVAASSVVALCREKLMLGSPVAYRALARFEPFLAAAGVM